MKPTCHDTGYRGIIYLNQATFYGIYWVDSVANKPSIMPILCTNTISYSLATNGYLRANKKLYFSLYVIKVKLFENVYN